MTNSLPQPCARWADFIAAHPDTLSVAERRALDAHVTSCQACAAAHADFQRMDARIRSLPDPRIRPGLPRWLQEQRAAAQRRARAPHSMIPLPLPSLEKHMRNGHEPGSMLPAPTPRNGRRLRRVASWVTAVAAVVVIAVITTALLVSHTGKPGATGGQGGNTATPSATSINGWKIVPGLNHSAAQPMLAPSDPKVIYLLEQPTLRRSDDSGAHWRDLALPTQVSEASNALLQISSANAENIFVLLTFDQSSSVCSGGQASSGQVNAYSGYSCQLTYYSVDGGAHWGLMQCAACGANQLAPVGTIAAQGNHLYSLIYDQNQRQRLLMSADGGATWQFADASLLAKGQGLCGFATTPQGSAAFALAQAGSCSQPVGYLHNEAAQPQAQPGLSIWRMDDAGAHWTKAGTFPYQQPDTQVFRAVDAGGEQPVLFEAAGEAETYTRYVSLDGGQTWQTQPTAGILDSGGGVGPTQAALSDGTILMSDPVRQGSSTLYGWKPGSQAWRQIAPAFPGYSDQVFVSPSAGHDTIWVVTTYDSGDFAVLSYTL